MMVKRDPGQTLCSWGHSNQSGLEWEMLPNENTRTPKALNVLSEDVMVGGEFGAELEN